MVFNKIFVALDRSPQAPIVFEQALGLAQAGMTQLMLFHCLDWETEQRANPLLGIGTLADVNASGTLYKLHHESLQKDIAEVGDWLKTYRQEAASKNIPTEIDCKIGIPSSSICDRAKKWGADLIVLGRRGNSGLAELLLGSVSNYVVHHAHCSVSIVQEAVNPSSST
jgi:nucleotide-binding universal stress UspA family protein